VALLQTPPKREGEREKQKIRAWKSRCSRAEKNIALTCQSKGPTENYSAKMDRATATTIFLTSEVPGEAVYVDIAIDLGL
jgi:hypothetical protein